MKELIEQLAFEGFRMFRSRGGVFTGEGFHPEHRHDAIEVLLPDRLTGEALTPLERIPFKNQYAIIIPANLVHATWKRRAKPGGGLYFIQFDTSRLKELFASFGLSPSGDSAIQWLFHGNVMMELNLDLVRSEIKDLVNVGSKQLGAGFSALFSAFSLLHQILRMRRLGESTPSRDSFGLRSDWTDAIIRHLEAHHAEPIGLGDLATAFGCSTAHLCRQFRRRTGSTPGEYLRYIRLTRAMTLLLSGEAMVGDVASAVGFEDRNHFTRCFKVLTGESPKAFQMRSRRSPNKQTLA